MTGEMSRVKNNISGAKYHSIEDSLVNGGGETKIWGRKCPGAKWPSTITQIVLIEWGWTSCTPSILMTSANGGANCPKGRPREGYEFSGGGELSDGGFGLHPVSRPNE